MRLDRLIQSSMHIGRRGARALLAQREVQVNDSIELNAARQISPFDRVQVGEQVLQANTPRYVILHKPVGFVSATIDAEHPTVIDLIHEPWADQLHLAGRLDRYTSGLVVLTNDSRFSEALTLPQKKVPKTYIVSTDRDITPSVVAAFEHGMPFAKEGVTTQPALIHLKGPRVCQLTIFEGKHHQIKRMFARFDIRVTRLHRESVGQLILSNLNEGAYRVLKPSEVAPIRSLTSGL